MSNQGPNKNEIAKINTDKQQNLKSMLMRALPSVQGIASKHLDPERLLRIALVAASRNQKLLDCSPASILSACVQAATVGLEPETPLQHAYLIPRRNKHTGTVEATFLPSYKGLILLASRGGEVAGIWARVVYQNEYFEVKYGSDERLEHVPIMDDDARGDDVKCVYACAKLKSGLVKFDVMTIDQINRIRDRSGEPSGQSPWHSDWEEMAKKTVIRRLAKTLPSDSEPLAQAIDAVERFDEPDRQGSRRQGVASADVIPLMTETLDSGTAIGAAREQTRADKAAEQIKARKSKPAAEAAPAPSSEEAAAIDQEQIKADERAAAEREKAERENR